jgi:hypothetical protein
MAMAMAMAFECTRTVVPLHMVKGMTWLENLSVYLLLVDQHQHVHPLSLDF